MRSLAGAFILLATVIAGAPAGAEEYTVTKEATPAPSVGFVEASGAYGFQFGEQPYVPTSDGSYKNPLTNGYAVGVTAGWEFIRGLALVGNWEYAASNSLNGEVPNAVDSVEGLIDYHTIAIGLRWMRALGPGRIAGELGAGVILPFETEIRYDFAGGMSTVMGGATGSKIDEYNLGVGAYGQLGYEVDIFQGFYAGAALRVKSFQSNNDGKDTRYTNFPASFAPPTAANMTVTYDADANPATPTPSTYSVQDLRFQLALGYRF